MKYLLLLSCSLLLLISCQNEQSETEATEAKPALDSLLVGNWESVSLRVEIPSINGSEEDEQILVPAGAWVEQLGMQPIRTEYLPNNTYLVEFRNAEDSLFQTDRGLWNLFGDTLMLIEAEATYQYLIRMKGDYLEYKATLDWDGDGEEDDYYESIHKKVEKKLEQ